VQHILHIIDALYRGPSIEDFPENIYDVAVCLFPLCWSAPVRVIETRFFCWLTQQRTHSAP